MMIKYIKAELNTFELLASGYWNTQITDNDGNIVTLNSGIYAKIHRIGYKVYVYCYYKSDFRKYQHEWHEGIYNLILENEKRLRLLKLERIIDEGINN